MGCVQRLVDILGGGARELCNRQAVHRRGIGEVLAFDRRNKLTADVVAIAGFKGNEGTFGTGMGVTHAEYLLVLMLVLVMQRTARCGACAETEQGLGQACVIPVLERLRDVRWEVVLHGLCRP
ncbi:hypothetical protein PSEUDO8BK_80381 [Pseudomonas sp. 8BK]|nr:hypothetical protein PSEUDO8BK_80381 [Pseudomonas sp. 8BK]